MLLAYWDYCDLLKGFIKLLVYLERINSRFDLVRLESNEDIQD